MQGTEADIENLTDFIISKVDFVPAGGRLAWQADLWYNTVEPDLQDVPPPSDQLEDAFNKVIDLYLKHQNAWDNADIVVGIDDQEVETESEHEQDSDVDLDDF